MNERSAHQVLCDTADAHLEAEIARLGSDALKLQRAGKVLEAARVYARQGVLIAKQSAVRERA